MSHFAWWLRELPGIRHLRRMRDNYQRNRYPGEW